MNIKHLIYSLSTITVMSLISACDHNDDEPMTYSYEIKVSNLTHSQPISPLAVLLHNEGMLWKIGEPASQALENMAESGDNSGILASSFALSSVSGAGVVMSGMDETLTVSLTDTMPMYLSLTTMLVNTNDAFTGLSAIDISALEVEQSLKFRTVAYDAGTEKNDEMQGTIPGPADGGEGFNAARDDVNFVARHSGVVSYDDGLSTSVLTHAHKFDNPVLSVVITRIK